MFWKSKKEVAATFPTPVCNANANIPECDSVKLIREYQKELDELENTRMSTSDFERKFQPQDARTYFYHDLTSFVRYATGDISCLGRGYVNYEEYLAAIGRDIDLQWARRKRQNELSLKISDEKNKLGIK